MPEEYEKNEKSMEEYENTPGEGAAGIKFENSSFFIILYGSR